ncbi:glutamine synthetase [Pelagibius litoralis]|uniref:Glutamine synthetase n=1 Tax=Pelagibius litoralis TaxID=374515 RepID=A0A967EXK3_9PROT|nr:glutamine synthetase family protein [Pelagibius litoralis]NIA69261.1 glutamine synthetase [Pelagibius litoralis]
MAGDSVKEMMAALKKMGARYVRFELPDLHGTSRTKVIPIAKVESYARKGLNFYGGTIGLDTASNVIGGSGVHEEVNYRDQMLIPDPATLRAVPWVEDTAKVICDALWAPGEPIAATPRTVLAGLLQQARKMGYDVMFGLEYEFYLLDPETKAPLFGGVHIFNATRNHYVPFLDDLLDTLQAAGIDVITHNCEYSPSQFEINYGPGVGLEGADKAFTFKNAIKELAHRDGYLATFMSKPASDMGGCGCHVHISLIDRKTGKNAFYTKGAKEGMNPLIRKFAAGLLTHAKAMQPVIGPTPNCYHRLKPHTFAPSNISWGVEDRTAMVRMKDVGQENCHIEMRAASGLANPYLAAAGVLAAGLLGLREKGELPTPSTGPSEDDPKHPKLAGSLEDALAALKKDKALQDMLGADFVKLFTTVKEAELARFRSHVTDWERDEYLEVY